MIHSVPQWQSDNLTTKFIFQYCTIDKGWLLLFHQMWRLTYWAIWGKKTTWNNVVCLCQQKQCQTNRRIQKNEAGRSIKIIDYPSAKSEASLTSRTCSIVAWDANTQKRRRKRRTVTFQKRASMWIASRRQRDKLRSIVCNNSCSRVEWSVTLASPFIWRLSWS